MEVRNHRCGQASREAAGSAPRVRAERAPLDRPICHLSAAIISMMTPEAVAVMHSGRQFTQRGLTLRSRKCTFELFVRAPCAIAAVGNLHQGRKQALSSRPGTPRFRMPSLPVTSELVNIEGRNANVARSRLARRARPAISIPLATGMIRRIEQADLARVLRPCHRAGVDRHRKLRVPRLEEHLAQMCKNSTRAGV